MSDFTQIRYEVSESIATITLNRPEKMNAFTGVMMREMLEVFDVIDADDSVRAVIVTGEGKAFCAGADLSGGAKTFDDGDWSSPNDDRVRRDGGGQVTLRIFECKKPVIAATTSDEKAPPTLPTYCQRSRVPEHGQRATSHPVRAPNERGRRRGLRQR